MGDALDWRQFPDLDALSRAAADQVVAAAKSAVAERGRFMLALSGGRTPAELHRLLAGPYRDQMPWAQVHIFWGDERYVPHDDARSNYHMARETLLEHVPVPTRQVHPMPDDGGGPDEAAREYEELLRTVFGNDRVPQLDLILLGMGADGHTASLFPGTPAIAERDRWVTVGRAPVDPEVRLTLTQPVLFSARRLLFLVTGDDKRPVLEAIRANPVAAADRYPAAAVALAGQATWYVA
jgi:6-phosphogluconolactonase